MHFLFIIFSAAAAFASDEMDQPIKDWFLTPPAIVKESLAQVKMCGMDRPLTFIPSSGHLFIEDGELVYFFAKGTGGNTLTYEGANTEELARTAIEASTSGSAKIDFLRLAIEPAKNTLFLMGYGMSGLGSESAAVWDKVKLVYKEDTNLTQAKARDLETELTQTRSGGKYDSIRRAMRTKIRVQSFTEDKLKLAITMDEQTISIDLPCRN